MENQDPQQHSLRQFFGGDEVASFKKRLKKYMISKEYKGIREEAGKQLRTIKWPGAATRIAEQAEVLLDTPVAQALQKVYAKADVLNKYLDPEQYDPEEVVLVELAEHAIHSKHEPYLDIIINQKPIGKVKFEINLTLELKGGTLKIQDAKIKEITPGQCKGSGSIVFYGKVLAEKKSEDLSLLGTIDLGAGISIAP